MFDMPDAKRVRREDLYNSDDDKDTTAESSALDESRAKHLQDQLAQLYGPIPPPPAAPSTETLPDAPPAEVEEEAFEFRLFAIPAATTTPDAAISASVPAQRIILSHSDDEDSDGAFIVPQRIQSWYIAAPATGSRKEEFEAAAVSTQTVLQWSAQRAWGLERPWRARVIRTGTTPTAKIASEPKTLRTAPAGLRVDMELDKKERTRTTTKPNKKRRIVLRMREQALAEKKVEAAKKEEEYAEKKTARNREKQMKRREKEKTKKAAAAAGLPDLGSGGDVNVDGKSTDVAT